MKNPYFSYPLFYLPMLATSVGDHITAQSVKVTIGTGRKASEIKTNGGQWKSSINVWDQSELCFIQSVTNTDCWSVRASFIAFFPVDFPQRAWWNLEIKFLSDLMNWENTFTQIELRTVTGGLFHAYSEDRQWLRWPMRGLLTNDWPIRSRYHAGLIRGKLELSWRLLRSDGYNIRMSLAEAKGCLQKKNCTFGDYGRQV